MVSREVTLTYNRSTVEAVVQHYFDGLYEGNADTLDAIFHPTADLRWVEKGDLKILTVPDWLAWVRKRPSAKAEGKPRDDFIVTIDRSDDKTAFIKVKCQLPPRYFTDYLVAMKLSGLKHSEVAAVVGKSEAAVTQEFSRSIRRLADALEHGRQPAGLEGGRGHDV